METTQYINISLYLNNKLIKTRIHPELTALKLIREQLSLTGTKESCSAGDCGSCTIAIGRWQNNKFNYSAIASCILPATKLHGTHVITIEGLANKDRLHIIQQMILENHAIQCGYCTPGIIMSLFCLFANNKSPSQKEIQAALEGNLCRCTGYVQISQAVQTIIKILKKNPAKIKELLFPAYIKAIKLKLKKFGLMTTMSFKKSEYDITESYNSPSSISVLFKLMKKLKGNFKIINGGTDIIVAANIHKILFQHLIDITNIAELNNIAEKNNKVIIGSAVTLSQILHNKLIQKKLPILIKTISQMSSTQIRNVATIAGNIANASPIADSACTLLGLNAKLILQAKSGKRKIALAKFYKGYKKINLKPTEIISQIEIPIPSGNCSFEKTSKRKAVEIATVNSMINLQTKNNAITNCHIAFGGVAPYPALAIKTAKFLIGKKLTAEIIKQAANIAAKEFTPIADVRGSDNYRNLLIHNHIVKHLQGIML